MGMDEIVGSREVVADSLPEFYIDAFDLIDANPNQVLLVAEENEKVIGTLQLTFIQYVFSRAFRRAVIEAMFVHPSHRGKGIGSALIQEAGRLAVGAGCQRLELTSNKARTRAHKFYEKCGFKATHEGFKLILAK